MRPERGRKNMKDISGLVSQVPGRNLARKSRGRKEGRTLGKKIQGVELCLPNSSKRGSLGRRSQHWKKSTVKKEIFLVRRFEIAVGKCEKH